MPLAVIVLFVVLCAISLRGAVRTALPIWSVMAAGAAAVILFGQISLPHALTAMDPDVMIYLFGVFLISQAAEECGYLEHITDKLFYTAKTGHHALLIIVFILGLASALIMNDTIAIIGTPILLQLCKSHKHLAKPLIYTLAFSVTIGSTLSPVGNPQNLLIAVRGGIESPFLVFLQSLTIPVFLNLCLLYAYIYWLYRGYLSETIEKPVPAKMTDAKASILVQVSIIMLISLILVKIFLDWHNSAYHLRFGLIAALSTIPLLFSKSILRYLKNLDWGTLIFFASTFILMQSVWDSGFIQNSIKIYDITLTSIWAVMLISVIMSQIITNVPLVTLYLPILAVYHANYPQLMALAAGSTTAGNLSILGAASNIIILQSAEKRGYKGLNGFEFMKLGIPLTIMNIGIYCLFIYAF